MPDTPNTAMKSASEPGSANMITNTIPDTVPGEASSRLSRHRIAIAILVIGILLRLVLVFLPFNDRDYPWRQSDTASIAHNFAVNGYQIFYPQINWGGAGPGYVEAEFQFYPFVVAILYHFFGEQWWLGNLVSLLFSIVACVAFYALAYRVFDRRVACWALAFFVLSPLYLHFSVTYMPESTVVMFYVVALYLFQCWLDEPRLSMLVLAALSTAMAILVKPTAIHIGLIFLLLLMVRYRWRLFRMRQLWLFALISLAPGALWYLHARDLYLQYGNTFGIISGGDSKFGNILSYWTSIDFYKNLVKIDLINVLAYAGVVAFAIGVVLSIRQRKWLILFGTLSVGVYYLLVPRYAGSSDMGLYYHIYFVPFAALGVGLGLSCLFSTITVSKIRERLPLISAIRSPQVLLGIVILAVILIFSGKDYRTLFTPFAQVQVACAQQVKALVPPGDRIIVSTTEKSLDNGVPNNYQDPVIFFYSNRYGWSLPSDLLTPQQITQDKQQGARYFVIYDAALYHNTPGLATYLTSSASQIGPGIDAQCGIYQLQ